MASQVTLVAELKELAGILAEESTPLGDARLNTIVDRALMQHNANYTYSTIPDKEVELVLYLAWITVCNVRASVASTDVSSDGGGFNRESGSKVSEHLKLAAKLRDDYSRLSKGLGVVPNSDSMLVTSNLILDDETDAWLPVRHSNQPGNLILAVSVDGVDSGTMDVSWAFTGVASFGDIMVFTREGTADIYQDWNHGSATGIPYVKDDAVRLFETADPDLLRFRLTEVSRVVENHFFAVIRSRSGRYTVSNEVSVAVE